MTKINQCQQNYKMNDLAEKNNQNVLSSPKARKFARELGVDVRDVAGSERLGRVIEKDIKEFVSSKLNKKENITTSKKYDHSEFGEVEIEEIPRIKETQNLKDVFKPS